MRYEKMRRAFLSISIIKTQDSKQVSGKASNFCRQDWKVLPIGDRRDILVPLISAKVEDHFQNLLIKDQLKQSNLFPEYDTSALFDCQCINANI